MTDATLTIRWHPATGSPRKMAFQPHAEGGHLRTEYVWTGCTWRETGCERVDGLSVEPRLPASDSFRGP